jgi:hypothetical protein
MEQKYKQTQTKLKLAKHAMELCDDNHAFVKEETVMVIPRSVMVNTMAHHAKVPGSI